jgi:hypothetical protein
MSTTSPCQTVQSTARKLAAIRQSRNPAHPPPLELQGLRTHTSTMRHTSVLQGGAKDLTQDYRITTMKRYLDSIGVDFAKAAEDEEKRRRRCKTPRRFATLGSEGTSLVNQLYERGDSMADEA